MPDWTYQTFLRPVLFRMPPEFGRRLTLGAMGALARLPLGVQVIRLFGHMQPDARLQIVCGTSKFPSPVGLGCHVDPGLSATRALAQFGFGYVEIGPIASAARHQPLQWELDIRGEAVTRLSPPAVMTPSDARQRLSHAGRLPTPILARVAPTSAEDAEAMRKLLDRRVFGYIVPLELLDHWDGSAQGDAQRPLLFAALTPHQWQDASQRAKCEQALAQGRLAGVVVEHQSDATQDRCFGKKNLTTLLATVREIRAQAGPQPALIVADGLYSPADALDAVDAGATLVQLDAGLAFSGPGLPKRINEALLYRQLSATRCESPATRSSPPRLPTESWFWAILLGLSLLGGGLLAMAVATTRVVLPYDEALTGLTRDQLDQINPRLLAFMTHDRVTLAGTMLAVGLQYAALAYFGIRRGMHWAYLTVLTSALAGFFTFFSFLGFGYFDPFHAFVSAILLQLTLLAMHAHLPLAQPIAMPELHNDDAWRAHQWGQLLFVLHGVVLIGAGATISFVGMTQVFVPEDMEFMGTTVEALAGSHPQLTPLVAHDRATFGGMLISFGLVMLLASLWGFRRGQAWLWWTLMIAGNIAYLSTLAVHLDVGYASHKHLIPVYGGLIWLWAGGLFSFPFMAGRDEELAAQWARRLAAK